MVVASASLAEAVITTVAPLAMLSATVLAVSSESVRVVTSDSSTSVRAG